MHKKCPFNPLLFSRWEVSRALDITMLSLAAFVAGCLEERPRVFFASDGVQVGAAQQAEVGVYRLPLSFKTTITHSAEWIYDVKASAKNNIIYVTAIFTAPPGLKESIYKDFVELRGLTPGVYVLRYRDPDRTEHDLGIVTLP